MSVQYSPRALADLQKIAEYIGLRNPRAAKVIIRRIETNVELINRHPGVGRKVGQRPGVHALPLGKYPYRIFYEVTDNKILVLHVRHTSRRLPRSDDLR